jgi:hypothetical protein
MQNEDLMRAYIKTRQLIKEDPENKDAIINEYIDLVDIINSYETSFNPISTSTNNELSKMLKNPLEIAIYNNFQRYNDNDDNYDNHNLQKKKSKEESSNFLASIYDLKYK